MSAEPISATTSMHKMAQEYEFVDDNGTSHTPTEFERAMLEEFGEYVLSETEQADRARIRALEAACARKDAALRQVAEPRNWEEQDRARSIARAALGPWVPTHQHYSGATVRVLMRTSNKFVIYDFGSAGDIAPVAITAAEFDGPVVKQNATGRPTLDKPRYRPLTADEARAAVEGRS